MTTNKPQTERKTDDAWKVLCECGHFAVAHALNGKRCFGRGTQLTKTIFCPCPAFTPKKEEDRP